MPLIGVDFPSPAAIRGGWSALSAINSARGWADTAYATPDEWHYHDGGGNWACLRFLGPHRAILIGHDHEYSETYFRSAAKYFCEEETDLLADAPAWWQTNLTPSKFGEWIGFIYGWDGSQWKRAQYDKPDGFDQIGLLAACSYSSTAELAHRCLEAPGLNGQTPQTSALIALVDADANIAPGLLEPVIPGWDLDAGVEAAKRFLDAEL